VETGGSPRQGGGTSRKLDGIGAQRIARYDQAVVGLVLDPRLTMVACTPAEELFIAVARPSSELDAGVMVVSLPFTVSVKDDAELMLCVLGSVTGVGPAWLIAVV